MPDRFAILDSPPQLRAVADAYRPTAAISETFTRNSQFASVGALLTGRLHLCAIYLPTATLITSITYCSGTNAAGTPTNQWFGLFNNAASPAKLAVTVDDLTTAWAANSLKTLALSAPFTTTYSGLHYLGVVVVATTPPDLASIKQYAGVATGPFALAPKLAGASSTGQTTPAAAPATVSAPSSAYDIRPYAYVS